MRTANSLKFVLTLWELQLSSTFTLKHKRTSKELTYIYLFQKCLTDNVKHVQMVSKNNQFVTSFQQVR